MPLGTGATSRRSGRRRWVGERVERADRAVALSGVQVLGIDCFATQDLRGCDDCPVPVGELEAAADIDGVEKHVGGHGLDPKQQDRFQESQCALAREASGPGGTGGLEVELLEHLHRHGEIALAQNVPCPVPLAGFLRILADGVQKHIGVHESHGEWPGAQESPLERSRTGAASVRIAARS